jgi:hypothetical protein
MSRYAWLVCEETKQLIWLGKICSDSSDGTPYFHIGDPTNVQNSQNPALMKAIMKFLAVNIGKTLKVWPEETFDSKVDDEFVEIGGDGDNSIPLNDYTRDFLG